MTAREALTQAIAFLANETRTLETSRALIDLLRADLPPDPPPLQPSGAQTPCINCGDYGGYETSNGNVGAFCEQCWRLLEQEFMPRVVEAVSPCPWTVEEIEVLAGAADDDADRASGERGLTRDGLAMIADQLRYLAARVKGGSAMSQQSDILTPEQVAALSRVTGVNNLVEMSPIVLHELCASHEALRAERDELQAMNDNQVAIIRQLKAERDAAAEREAALLREVANLPSPWTSPAWCQVSCDWCDAWLQFNGNEATPPHPDNGCLWVRAQQAAK